MWNIFRPKSKRALKVMRGYARLLIDDMKQHLSLDNHEIWLEKPTPMRNLGMQLRGSQNDEYYVFVGYSRKDYVGENNNVILGNIISNIEDLIRFT